jgi:hypothetical protein
MEEIWDRCSMVGDLLLLCHALNIAFFTNGLHFQNNHVLFIASNLHQTPRPDARLRRSGHFALRISYD